MIDKLILLVLCCSTVLLAQEVDTDTVRAPKPGTSICFGILGCFDNNPPFDNAGLFLPVAPELIKTEFKLHTSLNQNEANVLNYLDEESVRNSKFNKKNPFKLVIHGFQNSAKTPWVYELVKALVNGENGKVNVITVDWEQGAIGPLTNYNSATANIRVVSREVCSLVKAIRKVFYDDKWSDDLKVHCIGHSLGAHTCGLAAKACDGEFDRVTAMDPAGPSFEGINFQARVDKTDAKFVDVIHTNGGGLGMTSTIGDVDYYVNGGQEQPGCGGILAGLLTGCSHAKAYEFLTDSINNPCSYRSYPCGSAEAFEKGSCLRCQGEECAIMGYRASPQSRGTQYLMTRSSAPFCGQHYLIEVTVSNLPKKTAGEILVGFVNGQTTDTVSVTRSSDDINSNTLYAKVFVASASVASANKIYLQFNKMPKPLFSADTNAPDVYINKVKVTNEANEIYSTCLSNVKITDKQQIALSLKASDCVISLNKDSIFRQLWNSIVSN